MGLLLNFGRKKGNMEINEKRHTAIQHSLKREYVDNAMAANLQSTDNNREVFSSNKICLWMGNRTHLRFVFPLMPTNEKGKDGVLLREAEPEEGEITSSDCADIDPIDFEYEAISSDEEFSLRQKIEALEARNLELEKIASISARSQDAYGKQIESKSTTNCGPNFLSIKTIPMFALI